MNSSAAAPRPSLCCKKSDSITSPGQRSVCRRLSGTLHVLKVRPSFCIPPTLAGGVGANQTPCAAHLVRGVSDHRRLHQGRALRGHGHVSGPSQAQQA